MSRWRVSKLGDLLDKVIDNRGKNAPYVESGHEVIETGCISGKNKFPDYLSVKKYVDEATYKNWFRGHPEQGDILIITVGNGIGSVSIMQKSRGVITQNLIGLRFSKESEPAFYYYFLNQESIQDFLRSMNIGSAQPSLKVPHLRGIEVPVPALSEQKAIAGVLSSLDDKIDLLHRQNKTLEAMAETLFRQWFIVEAREDWEQGALGDILISIESGSRPKGGIDPDLKSGVPSVGAESINGIGNYDFSKTKYVTEDFFQSMNRGVVKSHDVLVYKDGAYVGRKGMFGNGFPFEVCSVNEHVFILRSNARVNQFFLYFLLQQEELSQLNTNSAQPGLNQEAMRSFEITIPPQEQVDSFGRIVQPWIDKIFFNSNQICVLEKLRNSLLPKLMTGEARVHF